MKLKISRILHAGYVFECGETSIAFDPIFENPFSRNCHAFPNVKFDHVQIRKLKFAAVFISHFHDDHCSLESLDFLDRGTPIYMYCLYDEMFAMMRELGFREVHPLRLDVAVRIGEFEVIPRRALDSEVDSMFHVQGAGLNVLNVVDSWIDPATLKRLAAFAPWDMVLWPFQTMRELEVLAPRRAVAAPGTLPPEWTEPLQTLNPRFVVPSSCQFQQEPWSWYNHALFPVSYRRFQEELGGVLPQAQVVRLNPSVSVTLDKSSLESAPPLPWVLPVGEQDVDYEYRPDLKPPPTAEIARRFAPLDADPLKSVWDYCCRGLIEKYNSMEPPLDEYFATPRTWRLSVFDHRGEGRHFHYRIDGGRMESLGEDPGALSWTTEIPVAKFYAALALGESLTSMYLRINDGIFDAATERELDSVDIVEDPLIRCLFTGAFGAYQAAQLKRLKTSGTPPAPVRSSAAEPN
jgi:hypothetical protein